MKLTRKWLAKAIEKSSFSMYAGTDRNGNEWRRSVLGTGELLKRINKKVGNRNEK